MAGYNRIILKGTGPDGEVWSTGLAFGSSTTPVNTGAALLQWATNVGAIIAGWTTNTMLTFMSDQLKITMVRAEYHTEDEKLANLAEYTLTSAKTGSGTLSKPLQCAMVVSLQTATPGRSGRGRMYWPALNVTLTAAGRFSSTNTVGMVTDLRTFIIAVRDTVDPAFAVFPAVRSLVQHQSRPVTLLRSGNVPDTQRRRRDALAEIYSSLAV